jgi:hypothetical protein
MCFIIKLLICGPFFFCDLTIMKLSFLQKKSVSTSHCSQPNTIEYDMALEWMLVREKAREKIHNTPQGRYSSAEDLYPCYCHVSCTRILISHVQLVCSGMRMTGRHLQIWAARMQRQGSSVRSYLVGYIFCIIDCHIYQDIFGRIDIMYYRLSYISGCVLPLKTTLYISAERCKTSNNSIYYIHPTWHQTRFFRCLQS